MLTYEDDPSLVPTIDLTPIIDMVFMLLTFFLVATTFYQAEREIKIALPIANSAAPISQMLKEMVINVDAVGRTYVGAREIDLPSLSKMISDAVRSNPEQKATIRGDRSASYENIVRVLDLCKANGIQQPYLDTVLGK